MKLIQKLVCHYLRLLEDREHTLKVFDFDRVVRDDRFELFVL